MDETDVQRRNHRVSHIARHVHAEPGATHLRFVVIVLVRCLQVLGLAELAGFAEQERIRAARPRTS